MTNKIEVKSKFLEKYLSDSYQIHFLGNNNEASLYIKLENPDSFMDSELFFWAEFEQTNNAPIIVLYLKLIHSNKEFVFDFLYDIKEENDIEELNYIISHNVFNINVMEMNEDILFFAFKYDLILDNNFIEELKRLVLEAQEYSRKIINNYDIDLAIDSFIDGSSIFNSKTSNIKRYNVAFPQNQEDEVENNFFTYKSNNNDFNDESDTLQVKVYKRDEYEKIKNSPNKELEKESYDFLKNRIKQLELIISSKNKELEHLRTENIHLKEELEYKNLDTPKKGWKLF